jgi:tetratricopeptide (TPR) repeat protein
VEQADPGRLEGRVNTIGPYRVLRPLARGGMAEVFEVEDPASGEHLALKLLMQSGAALPRFNREYEAMIRLNHPNIVRVYHYGMHGEMPFLTMELLAGTPVQAHAKAAGAPGSATRLREVIRIGHDVARALDHIHRRGLIHRDVKSANILVLPDGRVKLLDFGTAKVEDGVEAITKKGEFLGTFAYAAPEQILGKPLDGRADLYSLGILLYRLFSGVLPFTAEDPRALAKQQLEVKPAPLKRVVPGIPAAIDELVLGLLSKKPFERPETGGLVADRLEEIAGEPLVLPGTLGVLPSADRLVGREEELAGLSVFLDKATPGATALVVGADGAGVGWVLEAVGGEARQRGLRQAIASFGEDVDAFGKLLVDVGATFGDTPPAVVAGSLAMLRKIGADTRSMPANRRREVLRTMATTILGERAKVDNKPLVVQLRSLHKATPADLEVASALREAIARGGALVVWIASSDDLADAPGGPVRAAFPEAKRIALEPLTVRQVALMVGSLLHRRPPPAAVARKIHAACGGMPGYVEDVVRTMVDGGLLRLQGRDDNRLEWARREALEIPMPARVHDDVQTFVAGLPQDARRVLEALAVVGGDAPLDLIALAVDRKPAEIFRAVDELRQRGLLFVEKGRLRWRRRLAETLVVERMNACRRLVLEQRVANALLTAPVSPAQVRTLVEIGRFDDAIERALAWGERHLAASLPVTALEVLDLVVARAEESGVAPAELARLHLLHASCLLLARPTDPQTARSLQRAASVTGGAVLQAQLLVTRARVQRVIGHYPNYRALLHEAWNVLPKKEDMPTWLGTELALEMGRSLHMAGLLVESGDWLKRARSLAVRGQHKSATVLAEVALARWHAANGQIQTAEKALGRLTLQANADNDAVSLAAALPEWADVLRIEGRYSEALHWLDRCVPALRHGETPSTYVRLLVAAAWCEVELCRLGRAQELVDELAAALRQGEHLHLRLEADLVRGRIHLASGNLREAQAILGSVAERAKSAELVLLAEHARALQAETLWTMGKYADAEAQFKSACHRLQAVGDVPALAQACLARARAMAGSKDPTELLAPVRSYVETQPATVARLEWHLAHARWLIALKQDPTAALGNASSVLDRMAKKLGTTEQAAIRVHPWSRELRAAKGPTP